MINEQEKFLSDDEANVSRLLGSLKNVDAPGDFDFKVRGRIAKGVSSPARTSWFPASARVAVPLGLAVVVGSFAGVNYYYSPGDIANIEVAATNSTVSQVQTPPAPEIRAEPRPDQIAAVPERTPKVVLPTTEAMNRVSGPAVRSVTPSSNTMLPPAGGFYDEAMRESAKIVPPSVTGTSSVVSKVPTTQILGAAGITARFDGGVWRVISVSAGNIAERSGIKPGDVIETVDGQQLSGRTMRNEKYTFNSVTVRRNGLTMQINMKR